MRRNIAITAVTQLHKIYHLLDIQLQMDAEIRTAAGIVDTEVIYKADRNTVID